MLRPCSSARSCGRAGPFRLGPPSLDGLTRRRGDGLVRLLHVDGAPVVVAVSGTCSPRGRPRRRRRARGSRACASPSGIDDDLAEFHARFRDDPVIGRAVRARPWLRVRRNPDPWETLVWSITEQLIDMPRAIAIQRRMIAAFGRRYDALRDAPSAATIAAARRPSSRPAAWRAQARAGDAPGRARGGARAGVAPRPRAGDARRLRAPSGLRAAARDPRDRDVDGRDARAARARAARRRARRATSAT